jgi:hypothetical protein
VRAQILPEANNMPEKKFIFQASPFQFPYKKRAVGPKTCGIGALFDFLRDFVQIAPSLTEG